MLTFDQIKELLELVAARGLQGLELERSGFRLKIEGQAAAPQPAAQAGSAAPAASAEPGQGSASAAMSAGGALGATGAPPAASPASGAPGSPAAGPGNEATGEHILTSPIVGTFYRAPSPDAEPFTEVGARVRKGQVLCIIEAMKLMNEIDSDIDGTVTQIYPQNAQAVEFGEPLFAIRPA